MDGTTSRANELERLMQEFCQEWPDFLAAFLDAYEEPYGTGIRGRLRAAMGCLRLIRDRQSDPSLDRTVALLLVLLRLIEDEPEGLALLAPRLVTAALNSTAYRGRSFGVARSRRR